MLFFTNFLEFLPFLCIPLDSMQQFDVSKLPVRAHVFGNKTDSYIYICACRTPMRTSTCWSRSHLTAAMKMFPKLKLICLGSMWVIQKNITIWMQERQWWMDAECQPPAFLTYNTIDLIIFSVNLILKCETVSVYVTRRRISQAGPSACSSRPTALAVDSL